MAGWALFIFIFFIFFFIGGAVASSFCDLLCFYRSHVSSNNDSFFYVYCLSLHSLT